jgi:hypothetical protein
MVIGFEGLGTCVGERSRSITGRDILYAIPRPRKSSRWMRIVFVLLRSKAWITQPTAK